MKFTSIFFKTNESILEGYLKDTNKQVRNMKFTSIFFKTNESILEHLYTFIFSIAYIRICLQEEYILHI